MGMQAPPPKGGTNVALIIVIVLAVVAATGLGGCLLCTCIAARSAATAAGTAGTDNWITSERPFVKFIAPPGWIKNIRGDWGVFKAPNGNAVFAFTTFTQPGESTVRLGQAAGVLGVGEVNWGNATVGAIGRDNFTAHMGEGSCTFGGPGGYMWYATVNAGTSDQILLMYTVSARGTKADKDAALVAIKSLQRR